MNATQQKQSQPRIKIRAGTVAVGSTIAGRTVTGLGREWVETVPDHDACVWGMEPGRDYRVRMQYAYLEG